MKKKKIVIKVPMNSDKDKSKAMQIASSINGVSSVSMGKRNGELVVIGRVDSRCLANNLRKRFCCVEITSVEEVKPPKPKPKPKPKRKRKPFYYGVLRVLSTVLRLAGI